MVFSKIERCPGAGGSGCPHPCSRPSNWPRDAVGESIACGAWTPFWVGWIASEITHRGAVVDDVPRKIDPNRLSFFCVINRRRERIKTLGLGRNPFSQMHPHAAHSAEQPKHDENNQDNSQHSSESGISVSATRVVPAAAAKNQYQHDNEE
jgi:hypothetical protein